jgi:hypothetical protein
MRSHEPTGQRELQRPAAASRAKRYSLAGAAGRSWQAIAKAETVSGNAARLGQSVHLCLCKTPGQDRLAALLLLVQGSSHSIGR